VILRPRLGDATRFGVLPRGAPADAIQCARPYARPLCAQSAAPCPLHPPRPAPRPPCSPCTSPLLGTCAPPLTPAPTARRGQVVRGPRLLRLPHRERLGRGECRRRLGLRRAHLLRLEGAAPTQAGGGAARATSLCLGIPTRGLPLARRLGGPIYEYNPHLVPLIALARLGPR
jgi:hypothetical protein